MFTARMCEEGADTGKWYTIIIERQGSRRAGYCALGCAGHSSSEEALTHYLQYQLDREADLWLDRRAAPGDCQICGERTTLRARLGRATKLFVLCQKHQSTSSLEILFRQRAELQAAAPATG
jgi:hypothetical protein